MTDGIEREYKINRQRGTFKRHYGDDLAWEYEKALEKPNPEFGAKWSMFSALSKISFTGGKPGTKVSTRTIAMPICCLQVQTFIC